MLHDLEGRVLEKVDLFAHLPAAAFDSLCGTLKRRKFAKNTVIVTEGESCHNFYIVESGTLKVFVSSPDGKEAILNIHKVGDYFGELALIDGQPRSASVITQTESVLLVISRQDFLQFLQDYPEVGLDLMKALVQRIRELTHSVRDLALLDVYGRLVNLLESRYSGVQASGQPRLTHQDMANMVGASREMVSRIMRELTIGDYIEQTAHTYLIKKRLPRGW